MDDAGWEWREPTYRVRFWDGSAKYQGFRSETWRLEGMASVAEVVEWAEARRGDRTFELFVEFVRRVETPGGWIDVPGVIRIAGESPVDDPHPAELPFHDT